MQTGYLLILKTHLTTFYRLFMVFYLAFTQNLKGLLIQQTKIHFVLWNVDTNYLIFHNFDLAFEKLKNQ